MFRIKICGITNLEDAKKATESGADAIGFIFVESSPRKILPQSAAGIIDKLPKEIFKVGVFANQKIEEIKATLDGCKIDAIQFHGDETPEFCNEFSSFKIIKAFRVKDKTSQDEAKDYKKVDAFLLDAFSKDTLGGTGKVFDWNIARDFIKSCEKPVILSGGLTSENIIDAIKTVRPYAVDVSSGVESTPGKKDYRLLGEFIEKAKSAFNDTRN